MAIVTSQLHNAKRNSVYLALQRDLLPEWYHTLRALQAMPELPAELEEDRRTVLQVWKVFGTVLNLDEAKEKERHERAAAEARKAVLSVCAWKECRFHSEKPSHVLQTCRGCRDVAYCDRLCQSKDWKEGGHKSRCKRIKD
ncbi:hypothetical protein OF83DRAFT_1151715 [Amylostereum chailletii]|nr:hypothetical protein OF83DRAFT_1151715 [Amylostereum chailletii]